MWKDNIFSSLYNYEGRDLRKRAIELNIGGVYRTIRKKSIPSEVLVLANRYLRLSFHSRTYVPTLEASFFRGYNFIDFALQLIFQFVFFFSRPFSGTAETSTSPQK